MDLERIKMKVLESLEGAMDDASVEGYQKKPEAVAVMEEKTVVPVDAGTDGGEEPNLSTQQPKTIQTPKKDPPVYMNPGRQKVMDEIESQSAGASGVQDSFDKEEMIARMKRGMARS